MMRKSGASERKNSLEAGTLLQKRNEYRLQYCEDTSRVVMQLEREFDMIERKYNKLIEQKTVLQSVRWPASITFYRRASVRKITSSN